VTVSHRVARWLWWNRGAPARAARGVLLPFAFLYRTVMVTRASAYRRGWLRQRRLPLPAVAVGNLSVGGAGKTPLAAWIAAFFDRRGMKPGILLRGHGGDEARVHARLVPGAIVVPNPDRLAGAERARAAGARVLVLDDAYQRLDVARDVNVALVASESVPPHAVSWPLPAGPWREDWSALARADVIVVTRRRAALMEMMSEVSRTALEAVDLGELLQRIVSYVYERFPVELVAIAASTGGPAALAAVLGALPSSLPVPVVVVQHIAEGFEAGLAAALARHLDEVGADVYAADFVAEPREVFAQPA